MLRFLLEVWKAYAHRAASYQTRALLSLAYLLLLGPAALLGRLFGARLIDLDSGSKSTWSARTSDGESKTLAALQRQF